MACVLVTVQILHYIYLGLYLQHDSSFDSICIKNIKPLLCLDYFLKLSSRNIWGDYLLKLDDGILLQKEDDEDMMTIKILNNLVV